MFFSEVHPACRSDANGIKPGSNKHTTEYSKAVCWDVNLIRKMKTLDLSVDTQIELFDKMIKPILLYGSEIWGYSNVKPIERIHVKFLRSIFNLKQSTPNVMLYGEFGVYPIEIDVKVRLISFWSKVAATDSLKYSNMIYQHRFYSNVPSK